MAYSSFEKTNSVTNKTQQSFVVISWNVLHIIHEMNHAYDRSPVINRYSIKENWSNEKRRLNDIVKTISDLLVQYSTIECFICLQEVPSDLIPLLDQMLHTHVGSTLVNLPIIHVQTYSRKPYTKNYGGNSPYTDPNENLVTIHYNPYISSNKNHNKCLPSDDQIFWTPCPSDAGKGALTVTTASGLSVVNAHVPYNYQPAMSLLNKISWPENNKAFVLVGDMNCDSSALMQMLHQSTAGKPSSGLLFPVTTDKPTRVGYWNDGTFHKTWLDHYLISTSLKNSIISPAIVYDEVGDISDHYPISLIFKEL